MAGTRSVTLKQLKADAAVLESVVLHHRYASGDDLAPHRPGGAENPAKDAHGWLRYFVQLHRFHARGTGGGVAHAPTFTPTEADQMALLRGAPVPVELVGRAASGAPRTLYVHPKSLAALTDCYQRDQALGWLAARFHDEEGDPSAVALEIRARLLDELLYQQRVLVWIVTTPGPGLPFADTAERPEPPEGVRDLDALDIYRLIQAHQFVNGIRLKSLTDLYALDPAAAATRPSWTVFLGAVAQEMGVRTEVLIKDWSLGELIAQHALAAKARRDAEAAVKSERESA